MNDREKIMKNRIMLMGLILLLSALSNGHASTVGQSSGVREQVTQWFDEKKYLEDQLRYERGYGQLQEVVKQLLMAIKQKYSAIVAGGAVPAVTKNPAVLGDYMSGRYLKNIREGK